MTDLEPCAHYLGMEIQRCRTTRTVRITQTAYLKKVLSRFGMAKCAPAPTPMVVGTQLQEELVDQAPSDVVQLYQSMVGSVMYAMIQTRPDICYAVTILSRFNRIIPLRGRIYGSDPGGQRGDMAHSPPPRTSSRI